ncbi:MAG: SPFH domain-containing protein [Acidobacteriota bacterium]|jgi:flotillin|nr:SPFH domain-containing protein [Acidobacteriota bacterium]
MLEGSILYIIIGVVAVVVAFLAALWILSGFYIKVSPNKAAVISGRNRQLADGTTVGYRLVRGSATLVKPFLEKVEYLDLNVITVPLSTSRAYTVEGVPVSVKAVANIKIKGDDSSLRSAAERFLGMPEAEFHQLVFQTLEGHLRAILGTLTVEEINNDRQTFAQKLLTEAAGDLEKMGIGLDALTIQEIADEEGYLDALGKRRTAEVKRDAEIGEAEAKRDSKIKASLALQEGEKVRLATEAQIAQSNRETEIQKAQVAAEIEKERARARQAGPLSEAQAKQEVVAEEVRIEKIRTQEQISVQEQEVLRKEKELEATVVKQAEADRTASVLRARGAQESQILEAEGRKQAEIANAEAEAQKLQREGEGRAKAVEAEGLAEASRISALGKAEAERLEAAGLAKAKATEAQGLAEAKAIMEKAAAWREFNDAARLQTILEKLPEIISSSAPVFQAIAEPLGSIDKVVMIDNGNGEKNGSSSGLNRFAETSPNMIFGLLQKMSALGISLPEILSQLGVETDDNGNFKLSSNGDSKKDEPQKVNQSLEKTEDEKLKIDNGNQS